MNTVLWIFIAFMCGSLPFSVWVGRFAAQTDIRRYGDHNPGATNVTRAAGWGWGILALVLDISKGALPVGLAWYWAGLSGPALGLVALAPIIGHAYSPFLGFRGGKAIAVSGGVWIALTGGEVLIYLVPIFLIWFLILANDGWTIMLTMVSLLLYLLIFGSDPTFLFVWAGNSLLLGWKHRTELSQPPRVRPWLQNAVKS